MGARKLAEGIITKVAAVAALVIVPTAITDTAAYATPGIGGFVAPADAPPPPPPPEPGEAPPPDEAPPPGTIPRCPGALSGIPRDQWPHPCRRRFVGPGIL